MYNYEYKFCGLIEDVSVNDDLLRKTKKMK